jgi:hypothetical protein
MTQSTDEFRAETLVAIDAVKRALTIARRGVSAEEITAKGGRDLVTLTDVAIEDAVRGIVADALGFAMIGEERGGEASADGSPYWLVDPICGTRNFASGIPLYCVNLALVEGDEVTVAVVGDPSTGEIDVAERGRGAWGLKDGARHQLTTSDEGRTIVIEDGKSKDSPASRPRGSPPQPSGQIDGTSVRWGPRWPPLTWPPAASRRTSSSGSRPSTLGQAAFSSPKRAALCPISTVAPGASARTRWLPAPILLSTKSCSTLRAPPWTSRSEWRWTGQRFTRDQFRGADCINFFRLSTQPHYAV